jgi:AcrR family transcriptional regulator
MVDVETDNRIEWLHDSEWVFTPAQDRSRKGLEQVLRCAKNLFLEHGYENTTITQISKASGVSVGSIYHRFPDKQGILVAVLEIYRQARYQQMLELVAPERWAGKTIDDVVDFHLEVIFSSTQRDQQMYRLIERQRMVNDRVNAQVVAWDHEICSLLANLYIPFKAQLHVADLPLAVEYLHNIIRGSALWSILGAAPQQHFLDVANPQYKAEALRMVRGYLGLG